MSAYTNQKGKALILIGGSLIGVIYAGAITLTKMFSKMGTEISLPVACWTLGALAADYVAVEGLKHVPRPTCCSDRL